MTPVRHVIYLHGFASSPASGKARRFASELAALGVTFDAPDLNLPAFETLTVTRMLEQTHAAMARAPVGPVALIGSSLGAFVALHAENSLRAEPSGPVLQPRGLAASVDRLVLLAPALDFGGRRLQQFGQHRIDEWRSAGRVSVFHYAANEPKDIEFDLYEDAARYDAITLQPGVPTLIFQGRQDDVVDPGMVERWARAHPRADLRMIDDGHQLAASIDLVWAETRRFLGL